MKELLPLPQGCGKCGWMRFYSNNKITYYCARPVAPEKEFLDISAFTVNPDTIPDWCPLIELNENIQKSDPRWRQALINIAEELATLLKSNS